MECPGAGDLAAGEFCGHGAGAGGSGDERAAGGSSSGDPAGGLETGGLRVECVIGRIGASGGLEETEVVLLPSISVEGDVAIFERQIVPAQTGTPGLRDSG